MVTTVIFATYYESSIKGTNKRSKGNDRGTHPKIAEAELKFTGTEKLVESDKAHELIHISRNNNFDVCVNKERKDASVLKSPPPNKHIGIIVSMMNYKKIFNNSPNRRNFRNPSMFCCGVKL